MPGDYGEHDHLNKPEASLADVHLPLDGHCPMQYQHTRIHHLARAHHLTSLRRLFNSNLHFAAAHTHSEHLHDVHQALCQHDSSRSNSQQHLLFQRRLGRHRPKQPHLGLFLCLSCGPGCSLQFVKRGRVETVDRIWVGLGPGVITKRVTTCKGLNHNFRLLHNRHRMTGVWVLWKERHTTYGCFVFLQLCLPQ